jgi:hypothetical protein
MDMIADTECLQGAEILQNVFTVWNFHFGVVAIAAREENPVQISKQPDRAPRR